MRLLQLVSFFDVMFVKKFFYLTGHDLAIFQFGGASKLVQMLFSLY